MPPLSSHQSAQTTKLLLIGDNGTGKTSAIGSLAKAGYNVRVLDLDNGMDILANTLRGDAEAMGRVSYITVTDPMRNVAGKLVPRAATVWQRSIKLLDAWKDGEVDLGPVSSWTPQDVLVIDSLTMLANAALNQILAMNARLGQQPHQSDWYGGQQLLEGLFQTIFDEGIRCNVVINCHVTWIGEENGPQVGYPATLGKALSPKMGSYFNTILQAKVVGYGASARQVILTKSQGMVALKNSNPAKVPAELPLASGLADYFRLVRGETPATGGSK